MSAHAANQGRVFLELLGTIRPHIGKDRNLPERLRKLLAKDRRFGSRDRRLYRELLYTALRYWPWIEPLLETFPDEAVTATLWLAGDLPLLASLRASRLAGWPTLPDSLAARATQLKAVAPLVPAWFQREAGEMCNDAELLTIHKRAPLWIRIQDSNTEQVLAGLEAEGIQAQAGPLPASWRVDTEKDLTRTREYLSGAFEIQDLGSQLVLGSCPIVPGTRWLDACAGAGGKTLQLAQLLGADGKVDAYEPRPAARTELSARLGRTHFRNVTLLESAPDIAGDYDGVLVDAPCTGSGTWRRSPHLKYVTSEDDLARTVEIQKEILTEYARHVRSGGLLVYATCSLARAENQGVIADFMRRQPDFTLVPAPPEQGFDSDAWGNTLHPSTHDTDGFFVACLRRG